MAPVAAAKPGFTLEKAGVLRHCAAMAATAQIRADDRKKRLEDALRQNLRRRKEQARARSNQGDDQSKNDTTSNNNIKSKTEE